MLRFGVVILVASALAAPRQFDTVELDLIPYNEIGIAKNIGRANHLTDGIFSLRDGADINPNTITMEDIINDMGALPCPYAQALALSESIGLASVLSTGNPGDACQYSNFINAYLSGGYRQALKIFVNHIAENLDRLANQKLAPQSARYAIGPRSGCNGAGRTYRFEPAWDIIIANASPDASRYITEAYCTSKRLYYGFDVRSNIEAAAVTAFSLPPITSIVACSRRPLSHFLSAVVANRNISSALKAAKQSLLQCIPRA